MDVDLMFAKEMLVVAAASLVPEERSQRMAFNALMPEIFMLRNEGFKWKQIKKILATANFYLDEGAIRSYYQDEMVKRGDTLQRSFNEQLSMLAAMKKAQKAKDSSAFIEDLASKSLEVQINQRKRFDAENQNRMAAAFGLGGAQNANNHTPAVATSSTSFEVKASNVVESQGSREDDSLSAGASGGYGLAVSEDASSQVVVAKTGMGGFFDDDVVEEDPVVPVLTGSGEQTANVGKTKVESGEVEAAKKGGALRCLPLKVGEREVKRKPEVPDMVYAEGVLEHPGIPGLMLSRAERMYGPLLDYVDADGVVQSETVRQQYNRKSWKAPIPDIPSTTSHHFTQLNRAYFGDNF